MTQTLTPPPGLISSPGQQSLVLQLPQQHAELPVPLLGAGEGQCHQCQVLPAPFLGDLQEKGHPQVMERAPIVLVDWLQGWKPREVSH